MATPRRLRALAALLIACSGIATAQSNADSDAAPWLADLAALESGLARSYANFEYTLRERRIDLPAVDRTARTALASARDDAARRAAIDTVVAAFRDPHLRIEWSAARGDGAPPPACPADLRARQEASTGIRFDRLDGYTALTSDAARDFKAALYQAPGSRMRYGLVRIGAFTERAFGRACTAGAAALGIAPDAPCDTACERKLDIAVGKILNDSLAIALDELRKAGADRVVVDVTDNGGGSDWVEPVARIVGGPLRAARVGMLKHPVWRQQLDAQLARIDAAAQPATLATIRAAVARDRVALEPDCDLSAAWTDRDLAIGVKPLPCSALVVGSLYSTGYSPYVAPSAAAADELETSLFVARRYGAYRERKPALPVVVLVNENTHSSAELFAAVLKDSRRAMIAGSTSAGAGCGQFTDAGTTFTLPRSGATVHTPDCVRLRADGSNERRGIVPDTLVPWGPSDSAYQRAEKVVATLVRR